MDERLLTSFEALQAGLREGDPDASEASRSLLQTAHDSSRSKIVLLAGELPTPLLAPLLLHWFDGPWQSQTAAWWVCGYVERTDAAKAATLRSTLGLRARIPAIENPEVALQATSWLYCCLVADPNTAEAFEPDLEAALRAWVEGDAHPRLALSALQALLRAEATVAKEEAARVIDHAAARGLAEADILGMRCGFIESAERLVDEMIGDGPFALTAMRALSEALPPPAKAKLERYRGPRWTASDATIHVATVLAAHGDASAAQRLLDATKHRDLRRRGLAWSGLIRALELSGERAQLQALQKRFLRQPESVRAWVISELNPSCPVQATWLDQAQRYGTADEQAAVADAYRAEASRGPLVPDP